MISNVVHDEHSGSTYWLDNAFGVDDLAADLRFGSGLDNQRAVTVKSTFLQNRSYLDFYYREAFTVVEMETGPYCAPSMRSPTPTAIRSARRSTSQSSRSTSGSSTTPQTRRTRRRARSARAGSATTGWTRPTPPRSPSSDASSASREHSRSTRTRDRSRCCSGTHRVPRGLELGYRLEPLERIVDGVVVTRHRATVADALDRLGGEPVELGR